MSSNRYRKRPVEIEAMRWTGDDGSAEQVILWALSHTGSRTTIRLEPGQFPYDDGEKGTPGHPPALLIDTLEGTMSASAGDFIIRGVQGEFYPCKPSIFEATYEPVGGTS